MVEVNTQDIATQQVAEQAAPQTPESNEPQVQLEGQPADQSQEGSQQPKPDDLLSRVTRFVETETPANKSEEQIDTDIYNDAKFREKIESLQDPELKEYLVKLRKSGVSGVNSKLQEIAEIRKELQAVKEGIQPKGWDAQKVQNLLNDPEFLQVAQQLAGTQAQEEDDEYVPESVKKKLAELDQMKVQMDAWKKNTLNTQVQQEHNNLSTKYANYNTNNIDTIYKNVLEGKAIPNPEDIYKATKHDENVSKAYKLGLEDGSKGLQEKQQLSAYDGGQQVPNQSIKPESGESSKQFLKRIIDKTVASMKK